MNPYGTTSAPPRDIAIIGMACCYARARTAEQFWNNIINKVDGTTDVSRDRIDTDVFYDPTPGVEDKIYCKRGGWLGSHFAFNPLKYGTMPRNVEGAEPDQFLVLRTVYEAMEDAGYLNTGLDGKRVSFILGRGNYLGAGLAALLQRGLITQQTLDVIKGLHPEFTPEQLDQIKKGLRASLPDFGPETAPGLIPNITTGRVANRLDFMGKNFTVDAACASSLIAAELGIQGLVSGQDDMVLVGGVHVFTNVPFLQVFAAMGALSPTSMIRPFDADCDGTMPGEGIGILVMKRLEDAEAAGDRIYAVIKGIGSSSDGRAKSVTAPRVEGEELALRRAYEVSGVSPQTIELIEAHGTGTPVGDATEAEALHRVFGPAPGGPPSCAVGSIKSMIGHAMPAAGAAGIIKTALALYHRVLPPTLNCRQPLAPLVAGGSRFYVNTETRPWIHSALAGPRRAAINAFGFGGVNAHMVLEEYTGPGPKQQATLIRDWETELVVIEADTRAGLRDSVTRLRRYVDEAPSVPLRDIAYSRNVTLTGAAFRVSIVASSITDLKQKLERTENRLADPGCKQIKDSGGIYYFEETPLRQGKLALLFPGEGSQYLNMLSDLCIHFPEVRQCFDLANGMVEGQKDRYAPSADIFPAPFFSPEEEKSAKDRLWQMQRATEAVLTADGAVLTLLQRLNLKADMMAGHSAGEWIAMAASGILDINEFLTSMSRLDRMYRRVAEDTTIPQMVMLAVGAGREKVAKVIGEIDCTVQIANDNCPNQVVIVAEPKDADRVVRQIQSRGIFVEKLPYDRGYHTDAFTYICEPLREHFAAMAIRAPHTPVYCCTTAQPYPDDPEQILDHAANTFTRPLIFRQTIEAMYAAGARVFVEAGPRGNLTAFVNDILRGRPHLAVAIDQYRRPAVTTLNNAVGLLSALHVPLDLQPLYDRRSLRMLTWDARQDRTEDRDSSPGAIQVPLGSPRLESPAPLPSPPAVVFSGEDESVEFPSWESIDAPAADVIHVSVRERQVHHAGEKPNGNGRHANAGPSHGASSVLDSHFQLMESFLETQETVMRAFLRSGHSNGNGTSGPHAVLQPVDLVDETHQLETAPVGTIPMARIEVIEEEPEEAFVTVPPSSPARTASSKSIVTPTISVSEALLKLVSERTGYPVEMLGLDLDMEADLGIDSIKRIEILSALRQMGSTQELSQDTAMEEVARLKTLRQVLDFLEKAAGALEQAAGAEPGHEPARPLTGTGTIVSQIPGQEVAIVCEMNPEEHLYLLDHCFDPVGSEWDLERNGLYFVPMTVSLAIMAEVAALLCPGLKVVGAKNLQASRWIDVEKGGPRVFIAISAKRSDDRKVFVKISSHVPERKSGAPPDTLAEATIVFAPEYPAAPAAEALELVNARKPNCTGPGLYEARRMFHGPRFHGIAALDAMGDNGLLAKLDTLPRHDLVRSDSDPFFHIDPFLLDAAGQLVGYWPIEYCKEGFVLFPIRIEELMLYRQPLHSGERSICQMRIKNIVPRQLKADLDLIAPDGKPWMRVRGWEDWRFSWTKDFYEFWRFPNKGENGKRVDIRMPEEFTDVECRRIEPFGEIDKSMWENLWAHIILSRRELAEYRSIGDRAARARWVSERAIAKDTVRAWMRTRFGRDLYPADVEVSAKDGQFSVSGPWLEEIETSIHVSVAHDNPVTVAAVSSHEAGIEIESVVHWETGFQGDVLSQGERVLIVGNDDVDRDEWLTRAACAKKAAVKAVGRGGSGNLSRMVIESVNVERGEIVVICSGPAAGDQVVKLAVSTIRDGDYIIALAVR